LNTMNIGSPPPVFFRFCYTSGVLWFYYFHLYKKTISLSV
jgi:hypothetical protein